jgi:hypothetical protein
MFPIPQMIISVVTTLIAVDSVPNLNVEPSCRHVVARASPIRTMEACLHDEEQAPDQLRREWARFTATEKSECVEVAKLAEEPSYVALVSCLELRRDARVLRQQK